MGPWTQQSQDASKGLIDLGCTANATTPTPFTNPMGPTLPTTAEVTRGQGCVYNATGASVSQAQQNFVIEIPSSAAAADGQDPLLQRAAGLLDVPAGLKHIDLSRAPYVGALGFQSLQLQGVSLSRFNFKLKLRSSPVAGKLDARALRAALLIV